MLLLEERRHLRARAGRPRRHPRRRRPHRPHRAGHPHRRTATARRSTRRACIAVPGFIDGHVHMTGGGGEGGYATRTPELRPLRRHPRRRDDGRRLPGHRRRDAQPRRACSPRRAASTRRASARSSTPATTPCRSQTLTGSIERDLLLIDKVIGVGEVALSDHRSTQPTFDEFARLAAEARRGGILSGKAGVVNVHMGDGRRGLSLLRRIVDETEIPVDAVPADAHQPEPGAVRGGHRVREGRRPRGLHDVHRAGVPRRGRGRSAARACGGCSTPAWTPSQHHVHVGRPGQPAGLRRTGAAAAARRRPRDEPVRRGARRGARRGRAARDGAAGRSPRTPRAS